MTRKILVVDDDNDICEIISECLTANGFIPFKADTSRKALELIDVHNFAGMITDHKMPEMTGEQLIAKVRETGHKFPIFLLSGYIDLALHRQAWLKHAVFDVIEKPIRTEEIILLLNAAVKDYEDLIALTNNHIETSPRLEAYTSIDLRIPTSLYIELEKTCNENHEAMQTMIERLITENLSAKHKKSA